MPPLHCVLTFYHAYSFEIQSFTKTRSKPGRGVSEKVSAVGFCLGSGLFGSCNSD